MTMPLPRRPTLAVQAGDLSPATHGMTFDNVFYSLDAQAGRPAVLILLGRLPISAALAPIAAFQARAGEFAAHEADIVALIDMQSPHVRDFGEAAALDVGLVFCEPDAFRRWGFAGDEPMLVVIDRAARIVASLDPTDPRAPETALARIQALPFEAARDALLPAPVLSIPQIFTPELCRELIAHFEASAHAFGGMASVDAHGRFVHKIDEAKKHRFDFVLGPRDPYLNRVFTALILKCLPEVKKAFQVDACHTDRILIARYDDTGGYFRRHRDNAGPSVAFRQFALSVNLNADYEGGDLMFPEYNSHRYKPGVGAGVVFSCSLLHEAAPVTRGRRYVLLTFLHNAEAQARWLESTRRG